MASTSETGHAKNAANLETLIIYAESCGTAYKPSNTPLQLPELKNLLGSAQQSLSDINKSLAVFNKAKAERREAFAPLEKLVTRITNALKSSGCSESMYKDAMSISRKIKGQRATAKKTEEEKKTLIEKGKSAKEISASQTSIDNRIDNFDKLIELLQGVPAYNPNEDELKITALTAYRERLKETNRNFKTVNTGLTDLRAGRDRLFYAKNGLTDVAADVKSYMLSAFGTDSPKYKQVFKLQFVNLAPKHKK